MQRQHSISSQNEEEEDDDMMAPAAKRFRGGADEDEMMDDDVGIINENSEGGISIEVGGLESWKRPSLPQIDIKKDTIAIQVIDSDYTIGHPPENAIIPIPPQRRAIVRLYGVTAEGNSVLVHVHNFLPYFYVPCWEGFTQQDLFATGSVLEAELKDGREKNLQRYVLDITVVKKQSIWGYHFDQMQDFMKITMAVPALVATTRNLLQKGVTINNTYRRFNTYESNLPYVLRFMVDTDLRGGSWLEVHAGKYSIRPSSTRTSYCQLELDTDITGVTAHEPVGDWLKMAPIRVLSFDIECAGRKGVFPKPEVDPVIQIANVVSLQGSLDEPIIRNVFTLNTCAPIVGAQVISNATEEEMLMKWVEFFVHCDPDIITGYNICNFDFPYLLDRAKALKLSKFKFLGRIVKSETTMKNTKFESKAFGLRENKEIKIEGRVQFDLLDVIRREYKLRSYTLNAVSAHFLNQQKEDVHYSIISDLQNGSAETRKRLAVYCLKDAMLPIRLLDKLMLIINYVEMARVTGVPITYLLTRGQQIKVVSQLYRKALQHNLVIPVRDRTTSEDKYEGATVIEPKKAFYDIPIATLDFASLYPSIMMAHNLCYTTLIGAKEVSRLQPEQYVKTPNGDYFVKNTVKRGLLPEILSELLEARSNAKKLMKQTEDPFVQSVLNGRQLALKISANSVYGFTGAQVGQLPCLAISSSVTAFGREMIHHTKDVVEKMFTIQNGYQYDAEVVYGDTDSVMVKFGTDDVAESMRLGAIAAKEVTKEFISPIKLEFEKVYYPYLLMNKKRYAGLYWTNPKKWDKMDTKGIETVRRDNCALVSNVITECLHLILMERSVEKALDYTKQVISDLLCNKLDLSLLVISKSLGKSADAADYKSKQAHVELAERMRKRDPRNAPVVGDRVAYVITKAAKGVPAYDKAEDPIYVLENDIPIDTQYYLENQLTQPLTRIFEPILGDVKNLFAGDHTRKIKVLSGSSLGGGIMKFAVKKRTCLGCKVPLSNSEHVVCRNCETKQSRLYVQKVEQVREFESLYAQVWTQCQRCQGSLHQEVLCTSRDCPIFYRRKKVQKDLHEAQQALDRFSF